MSGGQQTPPPTQTTQQVLSPEQRELMQLALPGIREFAARTPQRYQGPTVAGFDPAQTAGQNIAIGAAPVQADLAASGAGANRFFTSGDIWNPLSNPYLSSTVGAAVRPIFEGLQEKVLPAIRGEATSTGNFGSSRQGIAEGLATREASRAAGDTASKTVTDAYKTNVDAQLKAMGLLPTVQGALTTPATTVSGVGDVRQALSQRLLDADVSGFNFDQYAPFLQSKEIMSLLQGLPGGSVVSTGSVPQNAGTSPSQVLGSAASGAALGSAIMPGIGTGLGAGAGALLPFLF